ALSDCGALHGRVSELQSGGHRRSVARALHRHLAGHSLWARVRGLLPVCGRAADLDRAGAASQIGIGVAQSRALRYLNEGGRFSKSVWRWRQSWPWKVSSIGVVAVPKLDHRIIALEERLQRLKQQHRQSEARRRTRESRRSRQDEGRRRDLVGAVVPTRLEQGLLEESVLRGWLDEWLTEGEDRELFGL